MRCLTLLRIRGLGCLQFSTHLENSSQKSGSLSQERKRCPQKEIKCGCPGSCWSNCTSRTQWVGESMRKDTNDELSPTQVLGSIPAHTRSLLLFWSQWQEHRDWPSSSRAPSTAHEATWKNHMNICGAETRPGRWIKSSLKFTWGKTKAEGKGSKRGTPERGRNCVNKDITLPWQWISVIKKLIHSLF